MKANELMIGDWVFHKEKPIQVYNVFNGSINETYYSFSNEVANYIPESEIEPIPLTPEILEKNGYTCKRSLDKEIISYNWTSPDIRVALNDQNGSPWFCIIRNEGMMEEVMIGITYVHELQHALRLCGIKKEIVL